MTSIEVAWLAGILEGEGYFGYNASPCINLAMTDLDIVERAAVLMGFTGVMSVRKRANCKDYYRVAIHSSKAVGVMMTVYSFMGARRKEKIREVLVKWRSQRTSPKYRNTCVSGHFYDETNLYIGSQGERQCKICRKMSKHVYREGQRARLMSTNASTP